MAKKKKVGTGVVGKTAWESIAAFNRDLRNNVKSGAMTRKDATAARKTYGVGSGS